jgi:hypothetical protein
VRDDLLGHRRGGATGRQRAAKQLARIDVLDLGLGHVGVGDHRRGDDAGGEQRCDERVDQQKLVVGIVIAHEIARRRLEHAGRHRDAVGDVDRLGAERIDIERRRGAAVGVYLHRQDGAVHVRQRVEALI